MLFLFNSFNANSQLICGTPTPVYDVSNRTNINTTYTADDVFCLNVKYHIVRQSNGTGGLNPNDLFNVHQKLNTAYNLHNIYFVNIGYDFIDNDAIYDLTDYNTYIFDSTAGNPTNIFNTYNDPTAINIFLNNTLPGEIGRARNTPSDGLILNYQYANSNFLAHEMGHCLNVLHTHDKFNGCTEAVNNEVNCQTCGDLVCDTPADRNLLDSNNNYLVNNNCQLIYNSTTNYPPNYNPDTKNIMSYTRQNCLLHFTTGQVKRMKDAIDNLPLYSNKFSASCNGIAGNYIICNPNEYNYASYNNNSITWTWDKPGIAILTTGSNKAFLNPIGSANGSGILKAVSIGSNGNVVTKQKTVHIGKPKLEYNCPDLTANCLKICRSSTIPKSNFVRPKAYGIDINSVWQWQTISSNFTWTISKVGGYEFVNITTSSVANVQFKVRVSNSCGWSDWQIYSIPTVVCSKNTELELRPSIADHDISIYPNIAKENVTIAISPKFIIKEPYDIMVYNLTGQLVLQDTGLDNKHTIDTTKLNNGLYVVVLKINEENKTYKIEVKH
jgi:hypothetical protein